MTLGTNNKKQIWVLAALGVVAAYFVYTNLLAGPDIPAASQRGAAVAGQPAAPTVGPGPQPGPPAAKRAMSRAKSEEFHPVYLDRNPANRPDPTKIDPTLKLDALAKVQNVDLAGGSRNLFQFAPAPPKEAPKLVASNEPIVPVHVWQGPRMPAPPAPPPPPPPPPPITLKFYGYSISADNQKRTAYLLDGDEIYLASEGQTLKRRYKIMRIGPTSILIEDLDAHRQQSVPLTEEGTG